jgi:hypothetical protein
MGRYSRQNLIFLSPFCAHPMDAPSNFPSPSLRLAVSSARTLQTGERVAVRAVLDAPVVHDSCVRNAEVEGSTPFHSTYIVRTYGPPVTKKARGCTFDARDATSNLHLLGRVLWVRGFVNRIKRGTSRLADAK